MSRRIHIQRESLYVYEVWSYSDADIDGLRTSVWTRIGRATKYTDGKWRAEKAVYTDKGVEYILISANGYSVPEAAWFLLIARPKSPEKALKQ